MLSKRLANLTAGRFFTCMLTALLLTTLLRLAAVIFHMGLPTIVGPIAFLVLFASRLWRVCSVPPPPSVTDFFNHM